MAARIFGAWLLALVALQPLCGTSAATGVTRSVASASGGASSVASEKAKDIRAQAVAEGKGTLVYAYGSDWSRSGREVLKAFRDPAFVRAVSGSFVLGEIDAAETPTPEIKAANAWCGPGDLISTRLPALFACDRDGRGFWVMENIPIHTTAKELLAALKSAAQSRAQARKLEQEAARLQGAKPTGTTGVSSVAKPTGTTGVSPVAAAEKLGAALAIYESLLGEKRLLEKKGQSALWERLRQADPQDRTGWQRRFTFGNGYKVVRTGNGFREQKDFAGGEKWLAAERAKPSAHLTVNQRQAIDMAEFALWRETPAKRGAMVKLLDRVAKQDPSTLWGKAATGWLLRWKEPAGEKHAAAAKKRILAEGETVARREFPTAVGQYPLRKRGVAGFRFDYEALLARDLKTLTGVKGDELTKLDEPRRLALVRAYILLEADKERLAAMAKREGGEKFLKALFSNCAWMESLVGSGPCHFGVADALDCLDVHCWNEPGIYTNAFLRTAATAMSLNFKAGENDARNVRALRVFKQLSDAGRLHDSVYDLNVYEWRYLWFPWDQWNPDELLWFNEYANVPARAMWTLGWRVPYRLRNCFGESVFAKDFYWPWAHLHSRYTISPEVGGVCNMISSFATTLGHAHGLMAVTAGQPRHCAFLVRPQRGAEKPWRIHYYIAPYTQGRWTAFGLGGGLHSILASEQLYTNTKRLDRDAPIWLARVRRAGRTRSSRPELSTKTASAVFDPAIAEAYAAAMKGAPGNWPAGRAWRTWLQSVSAPEEAWTQYAETVLATTGGQLVVVKDLIETQIQRLLAAGKIEAAEQLCLQYVKAIREPATPVPEAGNFSAVLGSLEKMWRKVAPTGTTGVSPVAKPTGTTGVSPVAKPTGTTGVSPVAKETFMSIYSAALAAQQDTPNYFMQSVQWGAGHYLGKPGEEGFLAALDAALPKDEKGGSARKNMRPWRRMLAEAEREHQMSAHASLLKLVNRLFPPAPFPAGAATFPESDFGGKLVTRGASVQYEKVVRTAPVERHVELHDASPLRPAKAGVPVWLDPKRSDWLGLRLGGDTEITGIRVVAPKAVPARVLEVSEDGKEWRQVGELAAGAEDVRLPLSIDRAQYVRITRKKGEKAKLDICKFLVYGRCLY